MSVVKCTRRGCDATLEDITDAIGRLRLVCRPCQRNKAGRCRDCSTGTVKRVRASGPAPLRCETCRAKHVRAVRLEANRRWYRNHRRKVCSDLRKRYRTDDEERAAILVRNAAYRRAHPRTEADRVLQRLYDKKHRAKKAA